MGDSLAGMASETSAEASAAEHGGGIVALVLGAGFGMRLRPLTLLRPKALCPVANVALVDWAIDRVSAVTDRVAVNVHAGRNQMEQHFLGQSPVLPVQLSDLEGQGGSAGRVDVQLSFEEPHVLGTAGALGQLRWWIDGAGVLVVNGDTWCTADLRPFVAGWDGSRVRMLVHVVDGAPTFGPQVGLAALLLPWREVAQLDDVPSGLYERCLRPSHEAGRLDVVGTVAAFFDCGTPASYLDANLAAMGVLGDGSAMIDPRAVVRGEITSSVVGAAEVAGTVHESVVWSGAIVEPHERLVRAIRADSRTTVLVRSTPTSVPPGAAPVAPA
jgi:MurNAc alpha-1-phosphate uridylyltransferase